MSFNIPTARLVRLLATILITTLLLSGCARYDVGIRFTDANYGEMTQRIRFDEELPGVGGAALSSWLKTFERQATQLGGQVCRLSSKEVFFKIPFYNAKDLQTKFNRLFYARPRSTPRQSSIDSRLRIATGNWIVWQHYHLQYDLDLRGLGFAAANSVDSHSSLELEFGLKTPWGAKPADSKVESTASREYVSMPRRRGRQLIWQLQPGKINHIEATFWLPSSLGMGTVLIGLLVMGGSYLKARGLSFGRSVDNQTIR